MLIEYDAPSALIEGFGIEWIEAGRGKTIVAYPYLFGEWSCIMLNGPQNQIDDENWQEIVGLEIKDDFSWDTWYLAPGKMDGPKPQSYRFFFFIFLIEYGTNYKLWLLWILQNRLWKKHPMCFWAIRHVV